MKFKTISGREINIGTRKYAINWGKVVSKPQKKVKDFLFNHWKMDQVLEEFLIPGSRLRIDILNLSRKIAVEVSPKCSHEYNEFFHKNRVGGYLQSVKRDMAKNEWIESSGFIYVCVDDLKNIGKAFIDAGVEL